MMCLLSMIIMFPLIFLSWILSVIPQGLLFWEGLLFEPVGAIIDMKERIIRFQFPLKKAMEHFPRKKMKLPFESIIRASYAFDIDKI